MFQKKKTCTHACNLPDALWKAKQFCTKHPIAWFISYHSISPSYHSCLSSVDDVFYPQEGWCSSASILDGCNVRLTFFFFTAISSSSLQQTKSGNSTRLSFLLEPMSQLRQKTKLKVPSSHPFIVVSWVDLVGQVKIMFLSPEPYIVTCVLVLKWKFSYIINGAAFILNSMVYANFVWRCTRLNRHQFRPFFYSMDTTRSNALFYWLLF